MKLGQWQLDTVSGGRFRLDGGAMFGVVPKPLWQRVTTVDDQNRIPLATNCVLARGGGHTVLIDSGYGTKLREKEQQQLAAEPGDLLLDNLLTHGVTAEDVDLVVLSHLHFDHAGGCTRVDESGAVVPTFPRATYVAGRIEWHDATADLPELRGSYPGDNLLPLAAAGQLRLVDDGEEIVPGLRVQHTGGHTRGHQIIRFESGGETAAYLGDLCPTTAHLRSLWCMAYDTFPLQTRRHKPAVLRQAVEEDWLILWDHDPQMAAARLASDPKHEFMVREEIVSL